MEDLTINQAALVKPGSSGREGWIDATVAIDLLKAHRSAQGGKALVPRAAAFNFPSARRPRPHHRFLHLNESGP